MKILGRKVIRASAIVYLVGVVLLGLFYEKVKRETGGGALFVAAAVAYLLMLRFIGFLVEKRSHKES